MNTIFDSVSALQRFRNRHALQISSPNHSSSYILSCKIRKILNREFTDEVWARYWAEHRYSDKSKTDRASKLQHFIDRLERLQAPHMKFILSEYDKDGIWGVAEVLSLPIAKLIRLAAERRKNEKEEVY